MDFTITYDFTAELAAARAQAIAVFEDWYEAACTARSLTPLADIEDFLMGRRILRHLWLPHIFQQRSTTYLENCTTM